MTLAAPARRLPETYDTCISQDEWSPSDGGCVTYPRYLGSEGVETFCLDVVETEGVLLLPASIYASEVATVPADRFRLGMGRRDPRSALAAFGRFLGGS